MPTLEENDWFNPPAEFTIEIYFNNISYHPPILKAEVEYRIDYMKKNIDASGFWNTLFGKKAKAVQEGDFPSDFHTDEGKEYYSWLKSYFAVTDYVEPDESLVESMYEGVDPLALPVSSNKQNNDSEEESRNDSEDDDDSSNNDENNDKYSYPREVLLKWEMKNAKVIVVEEEPKWE